MDVSFQNFEHADADGYNAFIAWLDNRLNLTNGVENRARTLFLDPTWRHDVAMSCITPTIIRVRLEDETIDRIDIYDAHTVGAPQAAYGGTRSYAHAAHVQFPPFQGEAYVRRTSRVRDSRIRRAISDFKLRHTTPREEFYRR